MYIHALVWDCATLRRSNECPAISKTKNVKQEQWTRTHYEKQETKNARDKEKQRYKEGKTRPIHGVEDGEKGTSM
jgi:hypothetical protein